MVRVIEPGRCVERRAAPRNHIFDAGATWVQLDLFCAASHSMEPMAHSVWRVESPRHRALRSASSCSALWRAASKAPALHVRIEHFQGPPAGVDLVVMGEIGDPFEDAEQVLLLTRRSLRCGIRSIPRRSAALFSAPVLDRRRPRRRRRCPGRNGTSSHGCFCSSWAHEYAAILSSCRGSRDNRLAPASGKYGVSWGNRIHTRHPYCPWID